MILDDIARLRREADIVVLAFHWGVIWAAGIIADYQVIAAHACIDAGADLILGHHAHVPKAIEAQGQVDLYSLSNFCYDKAVPVAQVERGAVEARRVAQPCRSGPGLSASALRP